MKNFSKKGFTLIELLVVITIIGILAVGGIQVYDSQIKKARDSTNVKNINIVDKGIIEYSLDNGRVIEINKGSNILNAKHFRDSIRTYIPNIDNIKHSASNKFCNQISADGCGFRYVDNDNDSSKYRLFAPLEGKITYIQCNDCVISAGIWDWFSIGNDQTLNPTTMPYARVVKFDQY